jgi:hypothetical protein
MTIDLNIDLTIDTTIETIGMIIVMITETIGTIEIVDLNNTNSLTTNTTNDRCLKTVIIKTTTRITRVIVDLPRVLLVTKGLVSILIQMLMITRL